MRWILGWAVLMAGAGWTLFAGPPTEQLSSLTVAPDTAVGGEAHATGTVTLTRKPRDRAGATVRLSSSSSAATVPSSVSIPRNSTSAAFSVTTHAVTAETVVTITATYNGRTRSDTLRVQPVVEPEPEPEPTNGYFVAPDGSPTNAGTYQSPWEIAWALQGAGGAVGPGDTLWLLGGTYKHPFVNEGQGFTVKLAGAEGAPIHVRPYNRERVTIDGGLQLRSPTTYLWLWDLEITVSEPRQNEPTDDATALNRPWGGLNVHVGEGCKFINLVIHDNNQGMSWWRGNHNSEMVGCVFYRNGWVGVNRNHGPDVYTQNDTGTKRVADCLFTEGYRRWFQGYGEGEAAKVNGYLLEHNIAWNTPTGLVGGLQPSERIRVLSNSLHNASLMLGWSNTQNLDLEVRNNVIVNGELLIRTWQTVVNEGNLLLSSTAARPSGSKVILRPNAYDPDRANLAVYNWERRSSVAVDMSAFLKTGDTFRLLRPNDLWGTPALSGTYGGGTVSVPMGGAEFGAWVVRRG